MDSLILLASMIPIPLIIIGIYLLLRRRRQHSVRHKRRKIRL